MKYRPKHIAEYILLRALAGMLAPLPYSAVHAVAWFLALIAYPLVRRRAHTARERIRFVLGPDVPASRIRRIAWISWRNTFFTAVEVLRGARFDRAWLEKYTRYEQTVSFVRNETTGGNGAILAVPHMGNWETAAVAMHLNGIPIFSIAATQKNPLTNDYFTRMRTAPGIEVFQRGGGLMKQVIRSLRSGRVLAILPDVRVRTEGVLVPFLGGQANLGAGMAKFARQCQVPILVGCALRHGWSHHEYRMLTAIRADPALPAEEDVRRMTTEVMRHLEQLIRDNPEQWFWYNKRWVLDPL